MITLKLHHKAQEGDPGAVYVDKVLGWWREEYHQFNDLNAALDFVISLYDKDPEVLRPWHTPFYFRGIDAKFTGNGDTTIINGKAESLEGWKMASVCSRLARNHLAYGRKLKKADVAFFRTEARQLLSKKSLSYEEGIAERGKRIWR